MYSDLIQLYLVTFPALSHSASPTHNESIHQP